MQLIDGKQIAAQIYTELRNKSVTKKLAVVLCSSDSASQMYVKMKTQQAKELGIATQVIQLPESTNAADLVAKLEELNNASQIGGILLQLPLYPHLKSQTWEIVNHISPEKDVDGLTEANQSQIPSGGEKFLPATVAAIMECIKFTGLDKLATTNIAVVNNSKLIGQPLAALLRTQDASVTILDEFSDNVKEVMENSDIVITATGQGQIFDHTYFKQEAIVIDVTSIKKDEKTVGDVVVNSALETKISWLTPVPGGVGPVTIACLLRNFANASSLSK